MVGNRWLFLKVFVMVSKTTHHMSVNASHFRSHSKIFDFRWMDGMNTFGYTIKWFWTWMGGMITLLQHHGGFGHYKIPLIDG